MEDGLNGKLVKWALIVLLFVAVAIYFAIELIGIGDISGRKINTPSEETVLTSFPKASPSSFYPCGEDGYFEVSNDGIKYYLAGHKERAALSLNLANPVAVAEGQVIAVFEYKGTALTLFSDQGELYTQTFDAPILNVSLNSAGGCAVITQGSEDYTLYVYNESGTLLKTGKEQSENVFPVASDLSNDGALWAISLLDINGAQINGIIKYVSLLAEDALDFQDGIVALNADNPDELIAELRFMDGNRLIAVSDSRIRCFDTANLFEEAWSIPLGNRLERVSFDGYTGFAVALGEELLNQRAEEPGTALYYGLDGKPVWAVSGNRSITYLDARFGGAVIGRGRAYDAIGSQGDTLWTVNAVSDIRQCFFFGTADTVIQVTETQAIFANMDAAPPESPTPTSSE